MEEHGDQTTGRRPALVVTLDDDGRIIWANQVWAELGWRPYVLVGRAFADLVLRADGAGRPATSFSAHVLTAGGAQRPASWTVERSGGCWVVSGRLLGPGGADGGSGSRTLTGSFDAVPLDDADARTIPWNPAIDPLAGSAPRPSGGCATLIRPAYAATPVHLGTPATVASAVAELVRDRRWAKAEHEAVAALESLRDALRLDDLLLYAQPICDAHTLAMDDVEVLIRLRAEDGRILMPSAFLPAAERLGVVDELDRWVIGQAATLAAAGATLAVNVSAQSIGRPAMLDATVGAILEAGAPPENLTFELTETALLEAPEAGARFAHELAAMGCRFALDDFGTGFGGLAYLKHFPVDVVKIDREFVADVVTNPVSARVVRSLTGLAKSMGQLTVAEGVEDEEALHVMRELGVDLVQGNFLGRPAPIGVVLAPMLH